MTSPDERLLKELRQRLDDEKQARDELLAELRRRREPDEQPVMRGVRRIDFVARDEALRQEEERSGRLDRHGRRAVLNRQPESDAGEEQ